MKVFLTGGTGFIGAPLTQAPPNLSWRPHSAEQAWIDTLRAEQAWAGRRHRISAAGADS